MNSKTVDTSPGNTPVENIPLDYFPKECGFWYTLPKGMDAGKKLFFRDSRHGTGGDERTIVLVHGNPESSYTYRKVVKHLTALFTGAVRIVAMDHIGFGLSDQASYEMVSMDHAENLWYLVQHLNLRNVTLVIHDWGGPIGVGAFLKEPERVAKLVILNTSVFPMPDIGRTYRNHPVWWLGWSTTPYTIPGFLWGCFAEYAIFCKPGSPAGIFFKMMIFLVFAKLGMISKHERSARRIYREQFKSKANVLSSKRLVRQSAVWGQGNRYSEPFYGERDTAPFYTFIQDNIGKCWGIKGQNIGVQAVSGGWDPLGKKSVIEQWTDALPQLKGRVQIFEDTGHFIEEVKPEEIAEAIIKN